MKVHVLYDNCSLGFLMQGDGVYVWTPNQENIAQMKEKHPLSMDMFFLPCKPCLFREIPSHYDEFLESAEREDLKEKVGILGGDSDFEKLFKLGFLEYFSDEFIIKSEV